MAGRVDDTTTDSGRHGDLDPRGLFRLRPGGLLLHWYSRSERRRTEPESEDRPDTCHPTRHLQREGGVLPGASGGPRYRSGTTDFVLRGERVSGRSLFRRRY